MSLSNYQFHFVVVGEYDENDNLSFSIDDDTCQARFDGRAIYNIAAEDWIGQDDSDLDDDLIDLDHQTYLALLQKIG